MVLPTYGVSFVRDALTHRESLLCLARKNAKSAIAAVLALGLLVGPLRRPGLRVGTCSISREKAAELLRQMREIAEASNLQGLEFLKTPVPGWVRTPDGSSAEFLSADKSAGHASGFDVVIIDELGLMRERDRDLVAGMRSSTSARDGRFIAISIRGESPLLEEMLARADLDTTAVHLFAPDVEDGDDVDIHDPKIWAAGNPGLLCGIKSTEYMVDEGEPCGGQPERPGHVLRLRLEPAEGPEPRGDLHRGRLGRDHRRRRGHARPGWPRGDRIGHGRSHQRYRRGGAYGRPPAASNAGWPSVTTRR